MKQRWLILLVLFVLGLVLLQAGSARAQSSAPEVVVIEATGPVIAPMKEFIQRGLREADERNAEALLILLDTPGGQLGLTLEIVQELRASDVPVIVYVYPPGGGAASAGLLITLAGHVGAMAPETAIGASSPVDASGGDLDETMQQKTEEFVSAEARSLAERRGPEAIELANAAVIDARAVSASEALEAGLIDFIAPNPDELLAQIDGFEVTVNGDIRELNTRGALVTLIEPTLVERALTALANPNLIALLLLIGPLLIVVEIRTPGGWISGTLGVIFTGLAFYGLGILPVNWLGLVFVGLAIVLFVIEVATPGVGGMAAAGAVSMVIGVVILFSQPELAPFGQLSLPLVIIQTALAAGLFVALGYLVMKDRRRQVLTGREGLVGQEGKVLRDLSPEGTILVAGERWQARSENGQAVAQGARVEVLDAHKNVLIVRPQV